MIYDWHVGLNRPMLYIFPYGNLYIRISEIRKISLPEAKSQ